MIGQRICTQISHQEQQITHVCLFQECDQERWLCGKCLHEQIHNHGTQIRQILNIDELIKKINQKKNQWNHVQNQLGNILTVSLQLSQNLQSLIQRVRQIYQSQQDNNWIKPGEILDITKIENDHFLFILSNNGDQNFVTSIMKEIDKLKGSMKQYEIILQQLENLNPQKQNIQQESLTSQDISKTIFKLQKQNYHESVLNYGFGITTAQISNNLKYIAGGAKFQLIIWNHSNLEILHQFQLLNQISVLKFTQDSQYLFICCESGFFYQLQTEKSFNKVFVKKLHQECINQIQIVAVNIIITADKFEIIKTDCLDGQTLLIIKIECIDFDYDVRKNILVSVQLQSVKLWNGNFGQKIIEEKMKNLMKGIQVLGNNNQLILRSDIGFCLYYINYDQSKLEHLRKIGNQDIISISPTFSQSFFVLLTNKSILIQSLGDNQIKRIDHNLNFQFKEKYSSFGYIISSKQDLDDKLVYVDQLQNIVQVDSMKSLLVTDGINVKIYKSN